MLGPRLPLGTRIRVKPWGAVIMTDRGLMDDKLICAEHSPDAAQRDKSTAVFSILREVQGLAEYVEGPAGAQRMRRLVRSG